MNFLIIDYHKLNAEGISEIIKSKTTYKTIDKLTNNDAVLIFLEKNPIDIAIVVIEKDDTERIKLTEDILTSFPSIKTLILSSISTPMLFEELFKIGVSGYISKNTDAEEFHNALSIIQKGETYYEQKIMNEFIHYQKSKPATEKEKAKITRREKEVLKHMINGNTTIEISNKLFVSKSTIDSHRKNILSKLNVKNTLELIKLSLYKKLV